MSDPALPSYTFTLNGAEVTVAAEPRTSALDVLRSDGPGRAAVLTMKGGCAPQGLCGCCMALVDGKPRLTCTLPVKSLAGKAVTTLEGVDPAVREALARAFTAEGGTQCGYCTPGIALSASALLAVSPDPTDDELHRALAPHLCRCTGYTGILDSLRAAGCALRGACTLPEPTRPEAREVVLGERPYVDDLVRPDAVHAVLVWAPGACGAVDVPDAEGVIALRTSVEDACQPVAVVWGETAAEARARAAALAVGFTPAGAPEPAVLAPAAPIAGAGVHVRAEVRIADTDPAYLEPEAVLVVPGLEGGGYTLYTSSTTPAAELAEVRAALPDARVRAQVLASGGSYGARTSPIPAVAAARVAAATQRPARLTLDLEEGMRLHPRRAGGRAAASVTGDAAGVVQAVALDANPGVAAAYTACAFEDRAGQGVRGAGVALGALAVERAVDGYARAVRKDAFAVRQQALRPELAPLLDALAADWTDGPRGVAVACGTTGFGRACVVARVAGADEVELYANVPETGQGRDTALVRIVARASGLPESVFHVPWGDPDRTGPDAWAPVEEAAAEAGRALAALGGRLADHVGVEVRGVGAAVAPGAAAAVVRLGEDGAITGIRVAVAGGPDQDPLDLRRVAEGAALMGVGLALSEEVAPAADGLHETRLRMLGVMKSKASPRIVAEVVAGAAVSDPADAALAATAAAVANAVAAFEGSARAELPMKDSAAARGVGVRLRPAASG